MPIPYDKRREYMRAYYEANKEAYKERAKAWIAKHPAARAIQQEKYQRKKSLKKT